MPIIPSKNRLLAKLLPEEKSINGILIPDSNKKKHEKAKVIATSSDLYDVDSVILFDKFADKEINHNGESFILLHEDHILATII